MEKLGIQLVSTMLFSVLGVGVLMASYKVFDIINPLDFDKELAEKNVALAIVLGGFFIAIAIIIGCTIAAPEAVPQFAPPALPR